MEGRAAAAVLGVRPGATKREISRAFRVRAKVLHPDASGSGEEFIALRAAFEALHPQAPDGPPTSSAAAASWIDQLRASSIDLTDIEQPSRSPTGPTDRGATGRTFADYLDAELQRLDRPSAAARS